MSIDPKDSEAKLILGAIHHNELLKLKSRGIQSDSLLVWGSVLDFVYDYNEKYKKLPSREALYLSYPDFPNFSTDGIELDYLIDVTIKNAKSKRIREILDEIISNGIDENPDETISQLIGEAAKIKTYDDVKVRYLDANATERYERYMEKKKLVEEGVGIGIETGILAFDKEGVRFMPGDFIIIIGPPGVGKSWTLLKVCVNAHVRGSKILYVCPEMTEHNVALRFDVVEGRMYGYSFSLEALRKGEEIDTGAYREWLERIQSRKNFSIVDSIDGGKFTVDKLEALVAEYDPDVVGIDSLTQFTTQMGALAVGWTDMIEITNAVKTLATKTKKIFVAIGPSTGDTFGTTEPAELHEIGLSRGAAYKPDVMVSMSRAIDDKMRHAKIIKMREGREFHNKMDLTFDIERGIIG